jgi:putative tricarboxylic transport membrane protein
MHFGFYELTGGLHFIAMIIGLFAIAESLIQIENSLKTTASRTVIEISKEGDDNRVTWEEFRKVFPTMLRSAPLGIFIGAIPGIGSSIAAFLAYGMAKNMSKEPEKFGHGAVEGVAAAESANNGVCGATFIPLLTLGVPGDVITAIMLGAFMVHGLIPGPTLFTEQGSFVSAFMIGMLITSCLHLFVALIGLRGFIQAIKLKRSLLFPLVIVLCITGTFVAGGGQFPIYIMLAMGLLGYLMIKFGFPIPPLLIGFILSPMIEDGLRQALLISDGDPMIFVERPIALGFLLATATLVIWISWQNYRKRART